MQRLKTILMTLIVSSAAFFMFFVGLGLTLFMFIVLAVMSLLTKSQSHEPLKSRWQRYYRQHSRATEQKTTKTTPKNTVKQTVIEGQYTVLDNQ